MEVKEPNERSPGDGLRDEAKVCLPGEERKSFAYLGV
jgi:hypothetical protein